MLLDELQSNRVGFSIPEETPGPLCHLSKFLTFFVPLFPISRVLELTELCGAL